MSSRGSQTGSFVGLGGGVNEDPLTSRPNQLEDGWNIEFDGQAIKRRGGRKLLSGNWLVRPTAFVLGANDAANLQYNFGYKPTAAFAFTPGDYTGVVADDSNSTTVSIAAMANNDVILVGMPFQFNGIYVEFGTPSGGVETFTVSPWVGSDWSSTTVTDNTTGLTSDGTIYWSTVGSPSAWEAWAPRTILGKTLYWIRIRLTSTVDAGTTIRKVRVMLTNSTAWGLERLGPNPNGLYVYRTRTGERKILVGCDHSGYQIGAAELQGSSNISMYPLGFARLLVFDEKTNEFEAVNLPNAAAGSGPGAHWQFTSNNGYVIATNGYGPPIQYDGRECTILKAAVGTDRKTNTYLGTAPWGQYLATFQSSLYIAGKLDQPNTVFFSNFEGDGDPGLKDAPAGGANLWSFKNNFDVGSEDGDVITGLHSNGYVLTIFKTSSIWQWDGVALRKVVDGTGCVAPNSIVSLGSGQAFLSSDGVYMHQGGRVTRISKQLDAFTFNKHLPKPHIQFGHAVRYDRKDQLRFWVEGFGDVVCLVFNYDTGVWSKFGYPPPVSSTLVNAGMCDYPCGAATTFTDATNGEQLFTAASSAAARPVVGRSAPQLWLDDVGYRDIKGTGYTTNNNSAGYGTYYPQPILVFKRAGVESANRAYMRYSRFLTKSTGIDFRIYWTYDSSNWRSLTSSSDRDTVTFESTVLADGTSADPQMSTSSGGNAALFGTDVYTEGRIIWVRLSQAARRRYGQMTLIADSTSAGIPFTLYGYESDARSEGGKQ